MNILPILGIALVAAVLVVLLRQYKPEFALPVEICAAVLILALLILLSGEGGNTELLFALMYLLI